MKRKELLLGAAALGGLAACHPNPYSDGTEPPWTRRKPIVPNGQISDGDWTFDWSPVAGKFDLHCSAGVSYKGTGVGSIAEEIGINRAGVPFQELLTLQATSPDGVHHGPQTFDILNNPWGKGQVEKFFEKWYWGLSADGTTGQLYINPSNILGTSVIDADHQVTHHNHVFQGGLITWDTDWNQIGQIGPNITMGCIAALAAETAACAQLLIDVAILVRLGPLAGPEYAAKIAADMAFVVASALAVQDACNK